MNAPQGAIQIEDLVHRYGSHAALAGIHLSIARGEVFGLLGPNGSGKSTLFRLASTLVPIQQGTIKIFGHDVTTDREKVRRTIGVVFQSPSLDRKLTVRENLTCQAALYGMSRTDMISRIDELLRLLSLQDRANDRCEKLSGGMKRRVELAKGLLHRPEVLLLDEPSTGLDPAARLEFWKALKELNEGWQTTIVMTTHLLEEADKCDRIAILDQGTVVAEGSPEQLRRETGETVISVATREPDEVSRLFREVFGWECSVSEESVRAVTGDAPENLSDVLKALGTRALSVTVGRPGLEDVFIRKTGKVFLDR